MDVRAAVAYAANEALVIETVQLEGPRAGEVLVEIKATGVCPAILNVVIVLNTSPSR